MFEIKPVIVPVDATKKKFMESFKELVNTEKAAAIKGELMIDELIANLHKVGQALLDASRKTDTEILNRRQFAA